MRLTAEQRDFVRRAVASDRVRTLESAVQEALRGPFWGRARAEMQGDADCDRPSRRDPRARRAENSHARIDLVVIDETEPSIARGKSNARVGYRLL